VFRPDQDRAFVIHFDRVELLQDLTHRAKNSTRLWLSFKLRGVRRALRAELHPTSAARPWPAPRSTTLCCSLLNLIRNQSARKAVTLLTHGVDNGSITGLSRAVESAQRADTLVYSILFTDDHAYEGVFASANGKKAMERLAHETGGAFLEVSGTKSITAI
jgi:hypothetical protein